MCLLYVLRRPGLIAASARRTPQSLATKAAVAIRAFDRPECRIYRIWRICSLQKTETTYRYFVLTPTLPNKPESLLPHDGRP